MGAVQVSGTVRFHEPPGDLSGATVYFRLIDTTMADAASVLVAQQRLSGPRLEPGKDTLRFRLPPTTLDPRRRYEVQVHVDSDGSGEVTPGDFLTMESHPVAVRSGGVEMDVRVRRV